MPITLPGHELLDQPGRPGWVGSIMDEYARACEELCAVVARMRPDHFAQTRNGVEDYLASPALICSHVVRSARAYSADILKARKLPSEPVLPRGQPVITSDLDLRSHLRDALRLTARALAGLEDATEADVAAIRFTVAWNVEYDPESILEHAICHILRHRRQLERWDTATSQRS